MTDQRRLEDQIRDRVAEIDKERDHLVALLKLYANGGAPSEERKEKPSRPKAPPGSPFEKRPGGPTERLLAAVTDRPGLKYAEVVEEALKGMNTEAENPKRSLGSTLGSLVKRKKIRKSEDGRYYPVSK